VLFPTQVVAISDASKRSFAVQGEELSRSEAMRLLALEGMDDAMALRHWDDRAKVHGVDQQQKPAPRGEIANQFSAILFDPINGAGALPS